MTVSEGVSLERETAPQRFRLKPLPVVFATALAFGLPFLAERLALAVQRGWWSAAPKEDGPLLAFLYLQHGAQAGLSLLVILGLKPRVRADFGLRRPGSLRPLAAASGLSFAVFAAFTVVAYLPNLIAHTAPPIARPLTAVSFAGWSFFQGVFVGPTEEILFRGLLVGYLATALPGSLRLGRLEIGGATVIAAVLFGLAHLPGSLAAPWWENLFHVTYACALGLVYGYWFERSRSLLVPAIAHNVTDLAAVLTAFGLAVLWR
jgi:hypothetical protein